MYYFQGTDPDFVRNNQMPPRCHLDFPSKFQTDAGVLTWRRKAGVIAGAHTTRMAIESAARIERISNYDTEAGGTSFSLNFSSIRSV